MAKEPVKGKRPGLLDEMEALEERRKARKAKEAESDDGLDLNRAWG